MSFAVYIRRAEEGGKVIFPNRFCLTEQDSEAASKESPKLSLEKQKFNLGPYQYGCQYLNDPVDDDSIEFKRRWITQFEYDEDTLNLLDAAPCIMSVDPAFRLKETTDFTGIAITKIATNNRVYVLEGLKLKISPDEVIEKIFELAEIYKIFKVKIERVGAQIVLADNLRKEMWKRGVSFIIEEYDAGTKETKVARIRGLIPHYANSRIVHRKGLVDLEEQLIQFPRGKHDDIVDALAAQISDWNPLSKPEGPKQSTEGTFKWWARKKYRDRSSITRLFEDLARG